MQTRFAVHPALLGLLLHLLPMAAGRAESERIPQPRPKEPVALEVSASRGILTRDPSTIIRCKDEYWVFYTGRGVPSYHSKDLLTWERGPAVFKTPPAWIAGAVPENRGTYWAPDVIQAGDRFLLYYSVSSLGKMTSAIGLASSPTLDPADPAYRWTDEGIVVQTHEGGDHNAIDPSLFRDTNGSLWMTYGSYWSGIKLLELDRKSGKPRDPSRLHSLAYNESIEAAFLCRHGDHYYLFVNWGSCCQGPKSTYHIRVGRSRQITGPYVDKDGVSLLRRGGSVVVPNVNGPLVGPGHAGILQFRGREWLSAHFEGDVRLDGKPTLGLMALDWSTDGWPVVTVPETAKVASDRPRKSP